MRRGRTSALAIGLAFGVSACTHEGRPSLVPPEAPKQEATTSPANGPLDPELTSFATWRAEDGPAFAGQPLSTVPRVGDLPAKLRPSLGGDYWNVPVRLGGPADQDPSHRFVDTRAHAGERGRFASKTFRLVHPYVSFLVGGGGRASRRVELQIKLSEQAGFTPAFVEQGPGVLGMQRVVWDVQPFRGLSAEPPEARVVLVHDVEPTGVPGVGPSGLPFLLVDDVQVHDVAPRRSSPPVLGFADLHVHLLNQLGFGGVLLHGCIWAKDKGSASSEKGPSCPLPERACKAGEDCRMASALPDCGVSHGKLGAMSSTIDSNAHHSVVGYPTFDGWPTFDDVAHQKVYLDWLKRAHDGGLRLIQLDVGNSQVLASAFLSNTDRHDPQLPIDDDAVIDLQIDAAWQLVNGPARSWAAIARTPAEARRIIAEGKLAIVLGLETDTFGGFTSYERVQEMLRSDPAAFRTTLTRLHDRGVRHVVPIHLTNNAFGGAAVFMRKWHVVTKRVTDHGLRLQNGFLSSGARYRLDQDDDLLDRLMELYVGGSVSMTPYAERGPLGLAHVNREGLSPWGRVLVQEMMKLGMLVDVDHMSDAAVEETLLLAKIAGVPVMASHGGPRALDFGARATRTFDKAQKDVLRDEYHTSVTGRLASERHRSDDQIRRIAALGGVIGVGIGTAGYSPEVRGAMLRDDPLDPKIGRDCEGSSVSFAEWVHHVGRVTGHRGVAFGTDVNGFAPFSGPRFGTRACAAVNASDPLRRGLIASQAAEQRAGVVYAFPPGKSRLGHFEGGGLFPSDQARAWQSIAAAFLKRPAPGPFDGKGADGFPEGGCPFPSPAGKEQGAFCTALERWNHAHAGSGPALAPSVAGERVFDLNVDGLAHYGLLPDLLQDMRNIGTPEADVQSLLYSAEDYLQMWERAEEGRARALAVFASDAACKPGDDDATKKKPGCAAP